ncbi:MAG: hypothetical protein MJ209_04240 [archaeon]|nr:hypothetical protein [archaeon]
MNFTDLEQIKLAIYKYGALAIDYQQEYSAQFFNTIYNNRPAEGNHIVALVGWDDNYSASKLFQVVQVMEHLYLKVVGSK